MALSIERYAAVVHPLKLKLLHKCIKNMVFKRGLLLAFQQHEGINPQNLDFDFCRYKYSSRHFICPVILYSILYNLPKFWELETACPPPLEVMSNQTLNHSTISNSSSSSSCHYWQMVLVARDFR